MTRFYILSSLLIFLFIFKGQAQTVPTEEPTRITGVAGQFAWELPGADLSTRFGSNGNIGGSFFHKTAGNYFFSVEGGFIFGSVIKYDSLFHLIKTPDNYIIDGDGMYADIRTYERGFEFYGKAGKVIPLSENNPNSGILLMAGAGFMQHKIRIENPGQTVAELQGDYKKGYDKLSNGPALSQFIGYIHFSDKRLYNFKAGFEFTQAFTQSRRNYDFDLMGRDTQKRIDLRYGIKISWMYPINKRKPADFYYN